jgi:hypothetical protein
VGKHVTISPREMLLAIVAESIANPVVAATADADRSPSADVRRITPTELHVRAVSDPRYDG